jgi:hypothetical protein
MKACLLVLLVPVFACSCGESQQQRAEDPSDIVGLPPPGREDLASSPNLRVFPATRKLSGAGLPPDDGTPKKKRIDLDARDADLRHVAALLADVGHASIVIGDDVKGNVSVQLKDVAWDDALTQVLASRGFTYDNRDGVLTVRAGGAVNPAPAPQPPAPQR